MQINFDVLFYCSTEMIEKKKFQKIEIFLFNFINKA